MGMKGLIGLELLVKGVGIEGVKITGSNFMVGNNNG